MQALPQWIEDTGLDYVLVKQSDDRAFDDLGWFLAEIDERYGERGSRIAFTGRLFVARQKRVWQVAEYSLDEPNNLLAPDIEKPVALGKEAFLAMQIAPERNPVIDRHILERRYLREAVRESIVIDNGADQGIERFPKGNGRNAARAMTGFQDDIHNEIICRAWIGKARGGKSSLDALVELARFFRFP